MIRSAQKIQSEWLTELLPLGAAWTRDTESNLAKVLLALADPMAALEADISALALEINPLTADLLLADYQRVLGADPYGRDIGDLTTDKLRELLFARWIDRGGQSIAYWKSLAATIGIVIEIYEPEPAVWGDFVFEENEVWSDVRIDLFTWVVHLPNPYTGLESIILARRQPDSVVVFVYDVAGSFGTYDFSTMIFGG